LFSCFFGQPGFDLQCALQTKKKRAKKGRSFCLKGFTVVFDKKLKNLKNTKNVFLKGFTVVFSHKLKDIKITKNK
jgi:hypothetical protein